MSEAVAVRFVDADPVAYWVRPDGEIGIAPELGILSVLSGRCNTTPAGEGGLRSTLHVESSMPMVDEGASARDSGSEAHRHGGGWFV